MSKGGQGKSEEPAYRPPKCPQCSFGSHVLESRRRSDGTTRRRFECQNSACGYRWTICTGEFLARRTLRERFSDEKIMDILTSRLSQSALARKYECSSLSIHEIQYGKKLTDILPGIPRKNLKQIKAKKSCYNCLQWQDQSCKIGWPDPQADGPIEAARYCPDYSFNQNASRIKKMNNQLMTDSEVNDFFLKWWSENYPNAPCTHAKLTHIPFGIELVKLLSQSTPEAD